MVTSQEMFMLFFSILYGIMLDSLIGRGAFPITSAFARRDRIRTKEGKEGWRRGYRSMRRLGLAVVVLNLSPLLYFAKIFQIVDNLVGDQVVSVPQIISIGVLSLGVFSFYYLFLGFSTIRFKGNLLFYTSHEHDKLMIKRRTIYPESWTHILAGISYLAFPWLVILFFRAMDILA